MALGQHARDFVRAAGPHDRLRGDHVLLAPATADVVTTGRDALAACAAEHLDLQAALARGQENGIGDRRQVGRQARVGNQCTEHSCHVGQPAARQPESPGVGVICSSWMAAVAIDENSGAAALPPKRSFDVGSGSSMVTRMVTLGASAGK